jgi:chromate transport protein ChrA
MPPPVREVIANIFFLGFTTYGGLSIVELIRRHMVPEKDWLRQRNFWKG